MNKLRAGDRVHHGPTDEQWTIAIDEDSNGDIMPCGWPNGWAKASDCTLIRAATDEQRIEILKEVVASKHNPRGRKALALLEVELIKIVEEKEKGLYKKYDVFKAGTKEEVGDCIVLKFKDPIARSALYTWASAMYHNGFPEVHRDIMDILKATSLDDYPETTTGDEGR